MLTGCEREYFWNYYGSWNGWKADIPQLTRDAYMLKQLTSPAIELGNEVHRCAREMVAAVKAGRALPTCEELVAQVRPALEQLCARSRGEFLRRPKYNPVPQDVFYRGKLKPDSQDHILEKMERCLGTLCTSPLWEELRRCEPQHVLIPDPFDCIEFEGVRVYAAPDVFFCTDTGFTVADWKTGSEAGVEEQLALYALFCRKRFSLPFRDGVWTGRVINLASGTDTVIELTCRDLVWAVERFRESIRTMRTYLDDVEANIALTCSAFPLVKPSRRWRCASCNFLMLCADELDRTRDPAAPRAHESGSETEC
jgi:hypothetical protein